jgi:proline dehydrogenase
MHRLKQDLVRADHCGYHFGVKLVRGAYMHSERLRAKSKGYPSPIHDTIEDTHVNYNKALEYIISYRHLHSNKVELLLGTHNKESIEHTIDLLHQYDNGRDYVYFAQLLGMSDNLTYNLGNLNYKSYKYVPYGKVDEVVPYLVRRIEENGSILGNVQSELSFIHAELFRRLLR